MPMILGAVGVIIVVIIVVVVTGGKKDDADGQDSAKRDNKRRVTTESNLDTAAKTNETNTAAKTDEGPMNAHDRAKNASYDMATLRPLAETVDRSKWTEIEGYIRDAYNLKADAQKAQAAGDDAEYKRLATQAIDTWRKGDRLFEDWQFEINGLHRDLWDACFQSEEKKYARSAKEMRAYMQFETRNH